MLRSCDTCTPSCWSAAAACPPPPSSAEDVRRELPAAPLLLPLPGRGAPLPLLAGGGGGGGELLITASYKVECNAVFQLGTGKMRQQAGRCARQQSVAAGGQSAGGSGAHHGLALQRQPRHPILRRCYRVSGIDCGWLLLLLLLLLGLPLSGQLDGAREALPSEQAAAGGSQASTRTITVSGSLGRDRQQRGAHLLTPGKPPSPLMTPFWGNFDRLRCQARRPGGKASLVLRVSSGHGRLSGALVALLNASAFRNPWVIGSELAKGPFTGLTTETTPGAASRCNKAGYGPQLGWRSTEASGEPCRHGRPTPHHCPPSTASWRVSVCVQAAMYPSLQQQTMMGGPGGMPPPHGPYSGMGQGDYPPQLPPPGMYPPLPQAQPPIRLARFPGDALHTAPMAAPGTMPLPPGMAPPQRAGSAGRQPAYGPPAGPMQQPFPMQPPRRMMGPGGPLPPPLAMAMGGMAPAGYQPQYMPGPPPPILLPSMMQQPPSPMHAGARSGHATPKSLAGSGANTPMHPLQRSLSNGQLAPTPGYPGPPGMLLPQQMGFLHMPPPPGMAALVAPPPGVVLPDSLSPGSPTPLRAPHGGGSAPGSRVQSATVMGHAGASSYGGSLMEPLASQVPAPIRAGLPRSGSTGSLPGSLRSSVDLSNSPARRSGERTPVGYFGGGGAGSFAAGAGGGAAKAGSKAGSAGRRTAGSAGGAQAAQPELDEYDNIKVGGVCVCVAVVCVCVCVYALGGGQG